MSPARPFIESRVADLRKKIDVELFAWLSREKHPNIEYSGSLPLVFWGPFLNESVAGITDTAFVAAREISEKNGIDPIAAAIAASDVAENGVRSVIDKMIDYDRKMRGKGFPQSVSAKDASLELKNGLNFISKRKNVEIEISKASIRERKRFRITLASLGTIAGIIGAIFTVFGPISCTKKDIVENPKSPTTVLALPQQSKMTASEVPAVHFDLPPPQDRKPQTENK